MTTQGFTQKTAVKTTSSRRWPTHGWVGLALVGVFWVLNWSLEGLRTQWCFFPLWVGYCLAVDAAVVYRTGSSLLTRSRSGFVALFLLSAPTWWLFEFLNFRLHNWVYLGKQITPDIPSVLLDSLSFSTVMPAVFETTHLAGSFRWLQRLPRGLQIHISRRSLKAFFVAGWFMLALLLIWPQYFFAFIWLAFFFILEPANKWLGNVSLFDAFSRGDWRPTLSLWLGVLMCGFFWELWNFYSYPKWVYKVPFIDFWHVFEMPLLGYLGYLPFAMELLAFYHFVWGLSGKKHRQGYISELIPGLPTA